MAYFPVTYQNCPAKKGRSFVGRLAELGWYACLLRFALVSGDARRRCIAIFLPFAVFNPHSKRNGHV